MRFEGSYGRSEAASPDPMEIREQQNMPLPFERSEYEDRIRRTKELMEDQGIDVLMVFTPGNMCYLTGYDAWSFYVTQMVVVALDEDQPHWIGRRMDHNAARVTTFLRPSHIHSYPDHIVQSRVSHPMDFVADLFLQKGWHRKRIGVEMDSDYFTARCFMRLKQNLEDKYLLDGQHIVNQVRMIKSPAEITLMKQAARIAERAMQVAIDGIRPGVRQCDVAGEILKAQASGTEEFGGDYTAIVPMMPTGLGTSTPHVTWSDRLFVEGEGTIIELAGCRLRYHCPIARTVHLGEPPQVLRDTAKAVCEGLNAALARIRPGVTCEEVEDVWRRTINRLGIFKESRIGYSTGLSYPPDWGEHTFSLRPGDITPLEPNMTLHVIPGIWMDEWGVEISECVRVTEDGVERFCDFPQDLVVKE